jgi:predicted dienelactone hydrolase
MFLLSLTAHAQSQAKPEGLAADGPLKVEVVAFADLTDAKSAGRKVPIKVHAPADGGPYPVVLFSHGAGGDWDTHYAQAHHLASHGYVVLCLEHVGSNRERMTKGLRLALNLDAMIHDADEVMARPRDVSFALDRAAEWNASHPRLRGRIDLARAGIVGHSFGAFTTMVACGMRPALDWLRPTVAPGKGLGPDLSDPRIRCGVALSPQGVGEPFFIAGSFGSLKVPLLGISGTQDRQQSGLPAENRREGFALWPKGPHRFVWIANAKHLDFTDSTGSDRRAMASASRENVQPVTRAATLIFLDGHLKPTPAADRIELSESSLRPYLRGVADKVELLGK